MTSKTYITLAFLLFIYSIISLILYFIFKTITAISFAYIFAYMSILVFFIAFLTEDKTFFNINNFMLRLINNNFLSCDDINYIDEILIILYDKGQNSVNTLITNLENENKCDSCKTFIKLLRELPQESQQNTFKKYLFYMRSYLIAYKNPISIQDYFLNREKCE